MFAEILSLIAQLRALPAPACTAGRSRMQQAATEEACVWCRQNSAVQRSAPVNSELQSPVTDAVAICRCPSRSEARSWPRNRRESDECRLKLRSAAIEGYAKA